MSLKVFLLIVVAEVCEVFVIMATNTEPITVSTIISSEITDKKSSNEDLKVGEDGKD